MKIKHGRGDRIKVQGVEDFVYEQLLYKEVRGYDEKVNLENRPEVVARAMGRMLNVLLFHGRDTVDEPMTDWGEGRPAARPARHRQHDVRRDHPVPRVG